MAKKATALGHFVYLDLSKVTVKSETPESVTINRDNWKILVCEATGKTWSDFTQMKRILVERTCEHINKLKYRSMPVGYISLDPSDKNQKPAKHAVSSDWAI